MATANTVVTNTITANRMNKPKLLYISDRINRIFWDSFYIHHFPDESDENQIAYSDVINCKQ